MNPKPDSPKFDVFRFCLTLLPFFFAPKSYEKGCKWKSFNSRNWPNGILVWLKSVGMSVKDFLTAKLITIFSYFSGNEIECLNNTVSKFKFMVQALERNKGLQWHCYKKNFKQQAQCQHTGFWFQGIMVQIPVGEKNFPLWFLSFDLIITIYLLLWVGVVWLYWIAYIDRVRLNHQTLKTL